MNNPNTDIIIIKGAPATGKSTTAKELTKHFPNGVRMEIDNLRSMVISVNWTDQEEHINILNLSTNLINDFLNLNYKPIIVVDTFGGDKLNSFHKKLTKLNQNWQISIYGLIATDDELKKRLDYRSDDKFKDYEICRKLNDDTVKFKHENEMQINTTGLVATETSKLIFENLMTINTTNQSSRRLTD